MRSFKILPIHHGHFPLCAYDEEGYPAGCPRCQRIGYLIVFTLSVLYAAIEFFVGKEVNSLSLVGDAAHMLFDGMGAGISVLFLSLMMKEREIKNSKRWGKIASFSLALFLIASGLAVFSHAWERLESGALIFQGGWGMIGVTVLGIAINLLAYRLYMLLKASHSHGGSSCNTVHGHQENILHANATHVLGDLASSLAVLTVVPISYFFNAPKVDLVVTFAIAAYLIVQALHIVKRELATTGESHHHH